MTGLQVLFWRGSETAPTQTFEDFRHGDLSFGHPLAGVRRQHDALGTGSMTADVTLQLLQREPAKAHDCNP
ncbi:hypothetical protein CDN98_05300 [Roseateles terrae]|nr:hypothetical protein CDN98_05300 [Roseateles terrae]